ncbi:MAG: ATP synthase F1 subunit epsilon [Bdellovibrionales bacterium]|nr:ATP synthase F1 subunit epsilon [Bdellovibrionales bacterium]
MADSVFELKLYTPAGLAVDEQVEEVTVPTSVGQVGILPQHAKYTAVLGTGVLQYIASGSKKVQRMVVSGGFVSFSENKLTVLADSLDDLSSVNRDSYASDRGVLQKVVEAGSLDDVETIAAKAKLDRIEAIDQLISH